jgi:RNA polymerase sigma factor (sigma-70 family)
MSKPTAARVGPSEGLAPAVEPDADAASACRAVVRALRERHGWAVLSEDEPVRLVLGAVSAGGPKSWAALAEHVYSIALHEACLEAADPARQWRAYEELHQQLYRVAFHRWPELAEDAAQRAIELVFRQIERCHSPGAFMMFALWKLRQALKEERRLRGLVGPRPPAAGTPEETAITRPQLAGGDSREVALGRQVSPALQSASGNDAAEPDLARGLIDRDCLELLWASLLRLPNPEQRQAILLRFLGELDDQEIAARLGVTVGQGVGQWRRPRRRMRLHLRAALEIAAGRCGRRDRRFGVCR